jgi:hypothetical protein
LGLISGDTDASNSFAHFLLPKPSVFFSNGGARRLASSRRRGAIPWALFNQATAILAQLSGRLVRTVEAQFVVRAIADPVDRYYVVMAALSEQQSELVSLSLALGLINIDKINSVLFSNFKSFY